MVVSKPFHVRLETKEPITYVILTTTLEVNAVSGFKNKKLGCGRQGMRPRPFGLELEEMKSNLFGIPKDTTTPDVPACTVNLSLASD